MPFRRSETEFFHSDETKDAIAALAESSSLIIYCGAGVTMDITDLGWGDLIYGLLSDLARSEYAESTERLTDADAQILRELLRPMELASIAGHYVDNLATAGRDIELGDRLRPLLYKGAPWKAGSLSRNIIRLAAGLSFIGVKVRIITTNFDTFIERAHEEYIQDARNAASQAGEQEPDLPGLVLMGLEDGPPWLEVPSTGAAGPIEVLYLHGRVQRGGDVNGRLVITEVDYHDVHAQEAERLRQEFEDANVLILGSSMTDPPLLRALRLTDPSGASEVANRRTLRSTELARAAGRTRCALIPSASTGLLSSGDDGFGRLLPHLRSRMAEFGVEVLVPDFYGQVAQFCQELLLEAENQREGGASEPDQPNSGTSSYGQRLISWWHEWEQSDIAVDHALLQSELAECLDSIRQTLFHRGRKERYKLELWVRKDPETRRLALWGSSAGVLLDRRVLKMEDLDVRSPNVSVRAFAEGRPIWLNKDDLAKPNLSPRKLEMLQSLEGRWTRYVSVPVVIEARPYLLPAGVITLAAHGTDPKQSTGIPIGASDAMDGLVQTLRIVGRTLLTPGSEMRPALSLSRSSAEASLTNGF